MPFHTVGEVKEYLSRFELSLVEKDATSIKIGFILNMMLSLSKDKKRSKDKSQKMLEQHLGKQIEDKSFKNVFERCRSHYKKQKKKKFLGLEGLLQLSENSWEIKLKNPTTKKPKTKVQKRSSFSENDSVVKKLRSSCVNCSMLECSIKQQTQDIEELKKSNAEKDYEKILLKNSLTSKSYTLDKLRKERTALKRKINQKSFQSISILCQELRRKKISLSFKDIKIKQLEEKIKKIEKENNDLIKQIKNLSLWADDLNCRLEKEENVNFIEPKKGKFDLHIRKSIYKALESKVPSNNVGELISYILKQNGHSPEAKLPSKSSVLNMAYEVSVLCTLQATEAVLKSDVASLCWDSTSLGSQHINEVHIELPGDEAYTLSMTEIPGGCTFHYVSHMTDVIDNMANLYASYTNQHPVEIKNFLLNRVTCMKSDRAIVNAAVIRELREQWARDFKWLHCNLHPLDGLSNEIKNEFKKVDYHFDGMLKNGTDCCMSNFLYKLSFIRIKQTGDPAGFNTFLIENQISPRVIPRYVGNKWNLLFVMSKTCLEHKALFIQFFQQSCKKEEISKSIVWGLTDDRFLAQLSALAVIGDVITTPWMKLFYANKERLSNLEMVPSLKMFQLNLEKFNQEPALLLSTNVDIFNSPLVVDSVLENIRSSPTEGQLLLVGEYIQLMLAAILKVSNRQLQDYITGELSEVTPDEIYKTRACAPHNVWTERVLGTYNALYDRAKQATTSLGFGGLITVM